MASVALIAATTLLTVGSKVQAGKQAVKEAEITAQTQELAATQREVDRKERLATAMATANANAGASGIAAFEGSPLTILQQSIEAEQTATERDAFNTRIGALTTRARAKSQQGQANLGAATSLLQTASNQAQLTPE
jgi:hypothetical protein